MKTNLQLTASPDACVAVRALPLTNLPGSVDVLVVGYGPVGATLANLLAAQGLRILVVDKATDIFMAPRAIALDNEALRILQMAGVVEGDFETIAIPHVRLRSPLLGEFGRLNTLGSIDGHPKLVTFYQPDLELCLRRRLARYSGATVALGTALKALVEDKDSVVASLEMGPECKHTVKARYLIGADGANSLVRQLIGQAFEGKTYAEDWLIVDAKGVSRPIDHVEFICDPQRPTPHMTAPGGRERWEFMLRPGEKCATMETDARIRELLAPWSGLDALAIERKAVYRFQARTANAFSKGRVFLAGDAAHLTPPFVGQGLVAGLRDAANLAWKLALVVQGHAAPQILQSYDEERRPHAKAMIQLAKLMGKLIMPRNAVTALITHGLARLARQTPLRPYFDELHFKPKNRFHRGLFVQTAAPSKLRRGALFPQGWVRNSVGTVLLSDDVLGSGLALIGFGRDARAALDTETERALAAVGGRIVQIGHRGQRLHRVPDRFWEDLEGTFLPRAVPFGWAAVVRPDRTVLHDGPVNEATRLVRESLALLGTPHQRTSRRANPAVQIA